MVCLLLCASVFERTIHICFFFACDFTNVTYDGQTYAVDFSTLNFTSSSTGVYDVRDIWNHKTMASRIKAGVTLDVGPYDSAFVLITPAK